MALGRDHFQKAVLRLLMRAGEVAPAGYAVAVSGGPDSMALLKALSLLGQKTNVPVLAYTFDHGLRPESGAEAKMVAEYCKTLPNVTHMLLEWDGDKPGSRLLETARSARYKALQEASKKNGMNHLFVAHHQDDQAETFLIRLSKGSGLDGLSAMFDVQDIKEDGAEGGFYILRPLLTLSKADLVTFCEEHCVPFVLDTTNQNEDYTRPRLRKSWEVLEAEGLTSKRLATTARRMARARKALETLAHDLFQSSLISRGQGRIVLDWGVVLTRPEELGLRVLMKALEDMGPARNYPPRMERVEDLFESLLADEYKTQTLAGCIVRKDAESGHLTIIKEEGSAL